MNFGIAPRSFASTRISVQFPLLPVMSRSLPGRRTPQAETAECALHGALSSSIATWMPGAMQSMEIEAGNTSKIAAERTLILLLNRLIRFLRSPFISFSNSSDDMESRIHWQVERKSPNS